ncbi:ATP synthase F1 subunit epsilon [Candidatus Roizmanbacteria bacterium CG_4_9_14_0_2_um_filter_39_13]|uniref:ATP synthase epsilon chain n=2 Tax=Candidatus Roizmaniibacteriota TaxID=1752723 RepID=A0A2M8EXC3_9BACT|nr:MAG: ATP synthase F1 subunit epsilon [Candidatus Roizmanbacteria bacterium CG_4_9_14_0_2_um_filter_39_13]PJE61962.1 MAG: ATP synthase F1 subunit epsilon [Candidatus Roizmanbacteria bacterium CG10_big_fil_rev_8_21_14_0_10_39_12]
MLHLKVITPKKLVYEEEVHAVVVPTVAGEITILPKHADLLSLLKEGVITIKKEKEIEYLSVGGGYLETDGKSVHILVSRAYGQDDINEDRAKEAIESAQKILVETNDKQERSEALSSIRRSTIDMKMLSKVRRRKSS